MNKHMLFQQDRKNKNRVQVKQMKLFFLDIGHSLKILNLKEV